MLCKKTDGLLKMTGRFVLGVPERMGYLYIYIQCSVAQDDSDPLLKSSLKARPRSFLERLFSQSQFFFLVLLLLLYLQPAESLHMKVQGTTRLLQSKRRINVH